MRIVGVLNERDNDRELCVWEASIDTNGHITPSRDLLVRRGYGDTDSLATTYEGYEVLIRLHIAPFLGSTELADLGPLDVQRLYGRLLAPGGGRALRQARS